ncbi:MAG: transposase [Bacteroidales bacterium]|nr:transposase [Bacteroidales bacterium]
MVFDRFHIKKIINEAVDAVHKKVVVVNPILKGSGYIFLKNQNS